MNEAQMRAECAKIEAEWKMGGLSGGVYEDFAVELARRAVVAERERCAKLCEGDAPLNMGKASMIAVDAFAGADWNAHSGFVCAQHACAAAIRKG